MRSEKVLALMMTKTNSRECPISSKLTVPLYGLFPCRHIDPRGQRKPLAESAPGLRSVRSPKTHGFSLPVAASRSPPQNDSLGLNDLLMSVGFSGSSHVHWRLKLDLKLCTPT